MNKDRNAFDRYMDEIDRPDLLTDDEERQLAQRIQLGDSRAIDRLTKANLTYVVSLARQYINRGLAFEDLVSEGNIGMLRAAAKYTADSGKRFVAFAAPYIREAMDEAVRQQGGLYRVPRNAEDVALENKRRHALSIDQPIGGSAELSLGRVIPDRDAPIPNEAVERAGLMEELRSLVARLDERDQRVVGLLYGLGGSPKTMAETARDMGIKRERVRQIRDKAIRRIGKMTKNSSLKDYLRG